MNQRSKTRQYALHYIYAKLQNGDTGFSEECFWEIALEKQRDAFRRSMAKLIIHLARKSQDCFRLLEQRAETLTLASEADIRSAMMRDELKRYVRSSSIFESKLISLSTTLSDKRSNDSNALNEANLDLLQYASVLLALGEDLTRVLKDAVQYRAEVEPLLAVMKRRAAQFEQLVPLAKLDTLVANAENKALLNAFNELEDLRTSAFDLATKALAEQERWEKIIEPLLTNYSLQRLGLLDKCTLFLMLYELKVLELPLPVIVSESSKLANSFSGGKSAPFIHGILAAAAKVEA